MADHSSPDAPSNDETVYFLTESGRAEMLRTQEILAMLQHGIYRTAADAAREVQAARALASFHGATTDFPSRQEVHNTLYGVPAAPNPRAQAAPNLQAQAAPNPQAQAQVAAVPHLGFTTTSNGRRRVSTWNVDFKSATSAAVRLPECNIGAVELITFFPNHTQWPRAVLRLIDSGWNAKEIATGQLHARGAISAAAITRRANALRHQVIDGGNKQFNVSNFTQHVFRNRISALGRVNGVASYDASTYAPRDVNTNINNLTTASLLDVARGVVNWPAPEDRGIVTEMIELAVRNNWPELTLDDIPQIAQFFNFTLPAEAGGNDWDQNARERILAAVEAAGPYN